MSKSKFISESDIDYSKEVPESIKEIIGKKVGEKGVVLWGRTSSEIYVKCGCDRVFISTKYRINGNESRTPISNCSECSNAIRAQKQRESWIGKKFGRLTVIDDFTQPGGENRVLCKCECYNFHVVPVSSLYGHSLSCGCLRREMHRKEDKTIGKTFGRLIVISFSRKDGNEVFYNCICECGKECEAVGRVLRAGAKQSCGCLHAETSSNTIKRYIVGRKGDKHPAWNPNITPEVRLQRELDHKDGLSVEWAKSVYKRDNWECQKCGKHGGKLNAHHIKNSSSNHELRLCLDNGCCLCANCHVEFHKIYTCFNNNLTQLEEYLGFTPKHLIYDPIHLGI